MSDLIYNQIAQNSINIVSDMPSVGIHVPDTNVGELISRQDAINLLKKWSDGYAYIETETELAIKEFEELPSAQKTGKWINHLDDDGHHIADCSECGHAIQWFDDEDEPKYCCMCGSYNGGEQE